MIRKLMSLVKYVVVAIVGAAVIPLLLEAFAAILHWLEIGRAIGAYDE